MESHKGIQISQPHSSDAPFPFRFMLLRLSSSLCSRHIFKTRRASQLPIAIAPAPQAGLGGRAHCHAVTGSGMSAAGPRVPAWELDGSPASPGRTRLKVVSFNLLAQCYVKSSFFPESPKACLAWKPRSAALLHLLASLSADIFLLQEVRPVCWKPPQRSWHFLSLERDGDVNPRTFHAPAQRRCRACLPRPSGLSFLPRPPLPGPRTTSPPPLGDLVGNFGCLPPTIFRDFCGLRTAS